MRKTDVKTWAVIIWLAGTLTACGQRSLQFNSDSQPANGDGSVAADTAVPSNRPISGQGVTTHYGLGENDILGAVPVDYSAVTIAAYVEASDGSMRRIDGVGQSGSFTIEAVPSGTYTLRVGNVFYVRQSSTIDLSKTAAGAPAPELVTSSTPVTLDISGIDGFAFNDRLEVFAPDVGETRSLGANDITPKPAAIATSINASAEWFREFDPDSNRAITSGQTWVGHNKYDAATGTHTLSRLGSADAFVREAQPSHITATMAMPDQMRVADGVSVAEMAPGFVPSPPIDTGDTGFGLFIESAYWYLTAAPGRALSRGHSSGLTLARSSWTPGEAPDQFSYPWFTALAQLPIVNYLGVSQGIINLVDLGEGVPFVERYIWGDWYNAYRYEGIINASELAALQMARPQNPMLDGQSAQFNRPAIGEVPLTANSLTPLLTWKAPPVTVPERYLVWLSCTGAKDYTFYTPQTRLRIPPDTVSNGDLCRITIGAQKGAGTVEQPHLPPRPLRVAGAGIATRLIAF